MPKSEVTTRHPDYLRNEYAWMVVRDVVAGSDTVKAKDTTYLPMPAAMEGVKPNPAFHAPAHTSRIDKVGQNLIGTERDPNWHPNPAYKGYKTRAEFPEVTADTLRGLIGIAMRYPPEVELPSQLEYLREQATSDGQTLEELYIEVLANNIQVGRHTLMLDARLDNTLYIAPYVAEDGINWKVGTIDEETNEQGLRLLVLRETADNGDDMFSHEVENVYRVLYLDEDDTYSVRLYNEEGELLVLDEDAVELDEQFTVQPSIRNTVLGEIPAVVIGSTDVKPDVDVVPMKGLANIALSIYRKTADQSQNQFMSCNPMLVVTGVDKEDVPMVIGSTVTWVLPPPDAKAAYTQTDTGALSYVQENINSLFERAESAGAQLLGSSKKSVEAAEALRLRQTAQGATLASIVDATTAGFERLLKMAAEWSGANADDVKFQGNKQFADLVLSSQDVAVLVSAWQSGTMSGESLFWNLQRSGYIPDDRTYEEEQELIAAALPPLPDPPPPDDDEDDESEDDENEDGEDEDGEEETLDPDEDGEDEET